MADRFSNHSSGLTAPASDWFSITLSGTALANTTRAIDCTGSGNVDITSAAGNTVTVTLTAGVPYPARAVVVNTPSTGSAATGVFGLI